MKKHKIIKTLGKIKMKKLKRVQTKEFKAQEKKLQPKVKKAVNKAIKNIVKNPLKVKGSMSLFGKPSAEELKQWMNRIRPETTDLVFGYLNCKNCLNKRGKELAQEFWERYEKK